MPRIYKTPARDAMVESLRMLDKPVSVPDLMELFPGMSRGAIASVLKSAHKLKLIRIAGWRHNFGKRGRISPLYGIADGRPDAVKPPAVPRRELNKQAMKRYNRRHGLKIAFKAHMKRTGLHPSQTGFTYKPKLKPLEQYGTKVHKIYDTDNEDE